MRDLRLHEPRLTLSDSWGSDPGDRRTLPDTPEVPTIGSQLKTLAASIQADRSAVS